MKKVLLASMLILTSSSLVTHVYAGAWQQAQDIQGTSGQASDDAQSGNYNGGRSGSGAGFDGNKYNPPAPPVDLRDKRGIVDPNDLRQGDPKPPSSKPSYVPPLP